MMFVYYGSATRKEVQYALKLQELVKERITSMKKCKLGQNGEWILDELQSLVEESEE